jgi:hypothetical protein
MFGFWLFFLLAAALSPASYAVDYGDLSIRLKMPELEADQLSTSTVSVKDSCTYMPTSVDVVIVFW